MEVLLSNASDRDSCSEAIVKSVSNRYQIPMQQLIPHLAKEIATINHGVLQEQGHYVRQRRSSRALSACSTLTSNEGPRYRLRCDGWIENDIEHIERSSQPLTIAVELERPPKSSKVPRFLKGLIPRVECISAGLSPNCEVAFLLSKSRLMLYDVRKINSGTVVRQGEEIPSPRGHMKEAVLSDTFIAFIGDSSLEVHEYSLPFKTNRVGK